MRKERQERSMNSVPEQSGCVRACDGSETPPAEPGTREAATGSRDRAQRIREWLLLLLRFAITRDPQDEAAAVSLAGEIDRAGSQRGPSAPSFFRRTSDEVCKAIITLDDPKRADTLKKHLARIDDRRLRRAFQAAVDLEDPTLRNLKKARPSDLWSGLQR
jgi:hypothetical protein